MKRLNSGKVNDWRRIADHRHIRPNVLSVSRPFV
ncbi:hypothetical protein GGP53_000744 [Salinibacter ruber]|nr:hypothetical protein [Salinibacter ruber]MCS4143811.1 hypothetical protein [Salinibacter ruber]